MQLFRRFYLAALIAMFSAIAALTGLQGVAAPPPFPITLGQTVTTNVPGPGAGVIETPGGQDVYTFTAPAGKAVYFDELTGFNCNPGLRWKCIGPKGEQVFDEGFGAVGPCDNRDVGGRTLTNGGDYTITVYAGEGRASGYDFRLVPVEIQRFSVGFDQTVTTNIPGPGAGVIEKPGSQDVYTFTAPAGKAVYFDELTGYNCGSGLRWKCVGPKGEQVFDEGFGAVGPCDNRDAGMRTLTNGGDYTVTVYGAEDGVGGYDFKIVPVQIQSFDIALNQLVTTNVPGPGAGMIEKPYVRDVFNFIIPAKRVVYFDELSRNNCDSGLRWRCVGPTGQEIFDERFGAIGPCDTRDAGAHLLEVAGAYTLTVYGDEDVVGSYDFRLVPVETQTFTLGLDQIVTTNTPGPGAGVIEHPGWQDVYNVNVPARSLVYFDELSRFNCDSGLRWRCVGPQGEKIFDEVFGATGPCDTHDAGLKLLTNGGDYTITVYGVEDTVGGFDFRLVSTSDQSFTLHLNETVTNGFPAAGAGIVQVPGATDTFSLAIATNTIVYFDARSGNSCVSRLRWQCITPSGVLLFDRVFSAEGPCAGGDPGVVTLTNAGIYKIVVSGIEDGIGEYSFRVWSQPPSIAVQPEDTIGAIGERVVLSVEAGLFQPLHYQWQRGLENLPGENGSTLVLDSIQGNQAGTYRVMVTNAFGSVTSRDALVRVFNGRYIPVSQAVRRNLPVLVGDGVRIQLFNGIGGGTPPTAALLNGRTADGNTLSPEIDFPRPGNIIQVGAKFDVFFANTTVPPETVRNLSARNFVLQNDFLLRVSKDLDLDPTTPEIEIKLGVGSDDGFDLRIGDVFVGNAGDRSFSYSWKDVAFAAEGLYPVTLLFAANAAGQSGLEFSWQTATGGGAQIVPQEVLYTAPDVGALQITFEENPVGAVLSNQYAPLGVVFAVNPAAAITKNRPLELVPVSPPAVWAYPDSKTNGPGELSWQFSVPGGNAPGYTDLVGFYLINARQPGTTVTAYDPAGAQVYSNRFAAGGGSQERVLITSPAIHRVVLRWPAGVTSPAVDNLTYDSIFEVPRSVQFSAVSDRTALPGGEVAFRVPIVPETAAVVFELIAGPAGASIDPATGIFRWNLPPSAKGIYPIVLRVRDAFGGMDSLAFSITVPTLPNLAVSRLEGPISGETSGTFSVTVREVNRGTGPATGSWKLGVWISPNQSIGAGSHLLAEVPFTGTLPAGQFIERTLQYRLPGGPGDYYIIARSDASDSVIELNEFDNQAITGVPVHVDYAYTAIVGTSFERGVAGIPIPLEGQALRRDNRPAVGELVNVFVGVKGTTRILSALTDDQGRFRVVFRPLLGEAGTYTIGAAHPAAADAPVQDQFTLLGMGLEQREGRVLVPATTKATQRVALRNNGDASLTGVKIAIIDGADGLPGIAVTASIPGTLPGNGTIPAEIQIQSTRDETVAGQLRLRITTTEGLSADYNLTVQVVGRQAHLVSEPAALTAAVLRGDQTAVVFDVANSGGLPSGPLKVLLPVSWIGLGDGMPLPALPAGGVRQVTLLVRPPGDLALTDHQGSLVVTDGTNQLNVPFVFRAVSDARASLTLEATDEYTFYAAGSPRVAGAKAVVREQGSTTVVTNGVTSVDGRVVFSGLREAAYDVEVSAEKHSTFRGTLFVGAGRDNIYQTFLARETVQYLFTVVPTEIEDKVKIAIETVFETFVPIPVVTMDPPMIDLADIQSDRTEIELKITNHGLVAAQDLKLNFNGNAKWQFTPLLNDLGDLAARTSITIPLVIERRSGSAVAARPQLLAGGDDCGLGGNLLWSLICATNENTYSVPFAAQADCPGGVGGYFIPPRGDGCCGAFTYFPVVCYCVPSPCDPCGAKVAGALVDCVIGFLPLGPLLSCMKDTKGCGDSAGNCYNNYTNGLVCDTQDLGLSCAAALVSCAELAGREVPYVGQILSALDCAKKLRDACKPEGGGASGGGGGGSFANRGRLMSAGGTKPTFFPGQAGVADEIRRLEAIIGAFEFLIGDPAWFHPQQGTNFSRFLAGFVRGIDLSSPDGRRVNATERAALLTGTLPDLVTSVQVGKFVDRWNRSIDYNQRGIFTLREVPSGESTDFLALDSMMDAFDGAADAILAQERDGFIGDPLAGLRHAMERIRSNLAESGGGVCARVRLRLDQEAVTTRSAFKATLELVNNSGDPLTNVLVELKITDANGVDAGPRFGILPPDLTGLTDVRGGGTVGTNQTGGVAWLLVPSHEAAPTSDPVRYFVGGRMRYFQGGTAIDVPLTPAPILVYPTPRIALTYFHERDVRSDDPFTEAFEPSIPYSLAVMVQNKGVGAAKNLRITSSQPKIIENEKGLLIDFQLIATEIAGQSLSPSLTADFGDLLPGGIKIGRWLFKSSLQGQFIDYSVTFENVGPLRNFPELSTIEQTSIHELIHIVRAVGVADDGQPDFLVNDVVDDDYLPDTLYLSQGTTHPVTVVRTGVFGPTPTDSQLERILEINAVAGWTYCRLLDPALGQWRLAKVLRGDGSEVPFGDNAWSTDRTFIAGGRRPRYENTLHLFDRTAAGKISYRLVYAPLGPIDSKTPVSQVQPLSASSLAEIPLQWSGQDDSGSSVTFDIFASIDAGPFVVWRSNLTTLGAIYTGQSGHRYRFYSVAVDAAGNREAAPLIADATTTVDRINHAPTLVLPEFPVMIDEGRVAVVNARAIDGDNPPDNLSFKLAPGTANGATLDSRTGTLRWSTGEGNGPGTNRFTIYVTDNGLPPLSATGHVSVIVREVNEPPVVASLGRKVINEGDLLEVAVEATDTDLPAQPLSYSLKPPTPIGMKIDSTTGVLRWRPGPSDGPATNIVTVLVSDGVASGSEELTVVVRDTKPEFELLLEETNLFVGESGEVPLRLVSGIDLDEITVELILTSDHLAEITLAPTAAAVGSVSVTPSGNNHYKLKVTAAIGKVLNGDFEIGRLRFSSVPGHSSALVSLALAAGQARSTSGTILLHPKLTFGRVAVVGVEPLLDFAGASRGLRIYGHPGETIQLELRNELAPSTWLPWRTITIGNEFEDISAADAIASGGSRYIRAIRKP